MRLVESRFDALLLKLPPRTTRVEETVRLRESARGHATSQVRLLFEGERVQRRCQAGQHAGAH